MQVVSDRYSALRAAIYVPSLLAESVQALEFFTPWPYFLGPRGSPSCYSVFQR